MGENLASLFESGLFSIFLVLFLEPKKGRKELFLGIILSSGLLFLNHFISNLYNFYNVCALIVDLGITALFWKFFLKGKPGIFLLGFALYYFGLYFSTYLPTFVFSLVDMENILTFQSQGTPYRIGFLLVTKTLLLFYSFIVIHFRKKFRHHKRGTAMLCYSILPFLVLAFFTFLTRKLFEIYRIKPKLEIKLIGVMTGMHLIVIAVTYLSVYAVGKAEEKYNIEKLSYMLVLQRESIEKFIGQERELYRMRHELDHKLFTVQYLFEKNQMEEGICVLKQMIVDLCGDAKDVSISRNIVETVIMNIEKKYETAEIRIEKEILFPDETIMELVDLCILLGDLLDNAMEAAAGSEEKQVKISVREEFHCLYLKIANTFSKENSDVKTFASRKKTAWHGFGMRNIREIVKRYGGELITYDEGAWFYADVIIYGQK